MEEISHLINATPWVFHKVIAQTKNEPSSYTIRCLVDHNNSNEDEIQDLYQAFIDVCVRSVASNSVGHVRLQLEYPDITSMDPVFDISRTCELFKKEGPASGFLTMKVSYYDNQLSKHQSYFRQIACPIIIQ